MFAAASERLRRLVPFDAAVWLATDPATSLPTAPTRTENMGHFGGADACLRLWELEFLVEDVNLYSDLAQAERRRRAADEHRRPPGAQPALPRALRPHGFADELRAVLRVDGQPWAVLSLFREGGGRRSTRTSAALVAGLSEPLAEAVRDHARPVPARPSRADHGPGLMVFDPAGELISVNDDALAWLDELAGRRRRDTFGVALPMVVVSTLMRRGRSPRGATAGPPGRGSARARPAAGSSATRRACATRTARSATPRS